MTNRIRTPALAKRICRLGRRVLRRPLLHQHKVSKRRHRLHLLRRMTHLQFVSLFRQHKFLPNKHHHHPQTKRPQSVSHHKDPCPRQYCLLKKWCLRLPSILFAHRTPEPDPRPLRSRCAPQLLAADPLVCNKAAVFRSPHHPHLHRTLHALTCPATHPPRTIVSTLTLTLMASHMYLLCWYVRSPPSSMYFFGSFWMNR